MSMRKLLSFDIHVNSALPALVMLATAVLVMSVLVFGIGCGGDDAAETATAQQEGALKPQEPIAAPEQPDGPPVTEQESPYGSGLTTSQTVGTIMDGVQLLDVRWADHGSYYRVVFDMGTPEGEPMLQVPHAEASLEADGTELRVLLGGIRSISDNPNAEASELDIGDDLVMTIRRVPSQDDQALLYIIDLSRPATYALAGLGSPGRIVVDIMKS